jgi:riboflavin biosynthesis pyrimidine reductase
VPAGQAITAGLVDELQLFLVPVIVGGGKRAVPDGVRSDRELPDTQRCCLPQVPPHVSVITSRVSQADRCARIGHPTVTQPDASQT